MGRPRKKARDLTNEQALRKLFPKKIADRVVEEGKKIQRKPSKEQG